MTSIVHSTQIEANNPESPCQNMVDKLGLTFGSSATSVRTSWNFTTTASANLGPQPSTTHDAALCEGTTAARSAQAAQQKHDTRHPADTTLRMHQRVNTPLLSRCCQAVKKLSRSCQELFTKKRHKKRHQKQVVKHI